MTKNIFILFRFIRIAFCHLTYFRINFFLIIGYWLISLSVLVIFWKALFQFLPQGIGDWDFPKLCLLNSICYLSWGTFVFFWGLYQIPKKVISGDLDKFLARPISPLIGLLGEGIHLEGIYEMLSGLIGLIAISWYYSLIPTASQVALSLFAMMLGTLALVFLHGVISISSFWVGRIDSLRQIIDSLDEFQKYPLSFYPMNIRWVLMIIVPLYFPGSFAASLYLGIVVPLWHWAALLMTVLFWGGLFCVLYQRGLRRYEANG